MLVPRYTRSTDSLILLVASVLLALRDQNEMDWLWKSDVGKSSWLPLALLIGGGFFGIIQPIRRLGERRGLSDRSAMDNEIGNAFADVLTRAIDLVRASTNNTILAPAVELGLVTERDPHALRHNHLALHIWRVKRTLRHPIVGELVRLRALRMASVPAIQPVRFLKDKGVTGECWKTNQEVIADNLTAHHAVQDEEQWEQVDNRTRRNLTWDEHERSKHCGAILATPIRRRSGKFRGCVSVDLPYGAEVLRDVTVRDRVQQLADRIAVRNFRGV